MKALIISKQRSFYLAEKSITQFLVSLIKKTGEYNFDGDKNEFFGEFNFSIGEILQVITKAKEIGANIVITLDVDNALKEYLTPLNDQRLYLSQIDYYI